MVFQLLILLSILHSVRPQGFEQVWVVSGRPVALNCEISRKGCFILSPSKRLFDGSKSNDDDAFEADGGCLLKMTSVEVRDFGKWTCFVAGKAVKVLEVSRASKPRSIFVETVAETFEARCVVKKAKPRPEFFWFLDDVPVQDLNATNYEDADLHYQSLFLSPEHSNKNLRCVINHISLDGPREAAIVINFAGIGTRNVGIDALVGLFAFVALLGFLFLMLAWAKNWQLFRKRCANESHQGDATTDQIEIDQFRNSRFAIRRLSEHQLLQTYGYSHELDGADVSTRKSTS